MREGIEQADRGEFIDPGECINCDACKPECPVEAIFAEADVPSQWESFTARNAERSAELKDADGHITAHQTPKEGPGCKKKA